MSRLAMLAGLEWGVLGSWSWRAKAALLAASLAAVTGLGYGVQVRDGLLDLERSMGREATLRGEIAEKSVQAFVLDYVVEYCEKNDIVIREYPQPFQTEENDYVLETNRLILKGNFPKILGLVYSIEQKFRVGKVSSLRFYKNRNNSNNTVELLADMYIQTIKPKSKKID